MRAISTSEILVEWMPPVSNGGYDVTSYEVGWDTAPPFTTSYDQGGSFGEAATNSVVVVPVQVKDGKGLVATGHVLVYIRDLNEPPRLTNSGGTSTGNATAMSARRVPEGTVSDAGSTGAAAGFVSSPRSP